MYRPSGIAVVTAGLAALALFHVIWGRDTRQAETWLQLDAPTPRAALDFGTTMQAHSGAWRAWPAPVEEEPVKTPVALPAPEVPAGVAPEAARAPDQSTASVQLAAEGEPGTASPTVAAGFVTFPETAALPAANAPTPPPPPAAEGRMALGGPEGQGRLPLPLRPKPTTPRRERMIAPPRSTQLPRRAKTSSGPQSSSSSTEKALDRGRSAQSMRRIAPLFSASIAENNLARRGDWGLYSPQKMRRIR